MFCELACVVDTLRAFFGRECGLYVRDLCRQWGVNHDHLAMPLYGGSLPPATSLSVWQHQLEVDQRWKRTCTTLNQPQRRMPTLVFACIIYSIADLSAALWGLYGVGMLLRLLCGRSGFFTLWHVNRENIILWMGYASSSRWGELYAILLYRYLIGKFCNFRTPQFEN